MGKWFCSDVRNLCWFFWVVSHCVALDTLWRQVEARGLGDLPKSFGTFIGMIGILNVFLTMHPWYEAWTDTDSSWFDLISLFIAHLSKPLQLPLPPHGFCFLLAFCVIHFQLERNQFSQEGASSFSLASSLWIPIYYTGFCPDSLLPHPLNKLNKATRRLPASTISERQYQVSQRPNKVCKGTISEERYQVSRSPSFWEESAGITFSCCLC